MMQIMPLFKFSTIFCYYHNTSGQVKNITFGARQVKNTNKGFLLFNSSTLFAFRASKIFMQLL
jgi:hypothetical protein